MRTRIQEQDFDFKKTIHNSPYYSSKKNYLGVLTICGSLVMALSTLLFIPSHKDKHVQFNEYVEPAPSLQLKSFSPSTIIDTQNSIKDIFTINASVYPDHATVRTGIINEKLDKIQGKLLKDISVSLRKTQFIEPLSIDSSPDKISLLSFDSINKTMTFEIHYSLNVKSNEKSPKSLNFLKTSHSISHIQVTFDKFSNLEDIQLVNII